MPCEFRISEEYCVDAVWLYCMATGTQIEHFDLAENVHPGESEMEAITRLVTPVLAQIGFPAGTFAIDEITEHLIDYDGFPMAFGDILIFFNDDAVRTITENFPDSITYVFSDATKKLMKMAEIDRFDSVTFVMLDRADEEHHDDQHN